MIFLLYNVIDTKYKNLQDGNFLTIGTVYVKQIMYSFVILSSYQDFNFELMLLIVRFLLESHCIIQCYNRKLNNVLH